MGGNATGEARTYTSKRTVGIVDPKAPVVFEDVTAKTALAQFRNHSGTPQKDYIIECVSAGVAVLDYDNDGLPDIFIVSGKGGTNRLYHNDGHDRFSDVTGQMGLTSDGWGQGVCAGDYDNDGFTDLFVTYWGQNRLYRNIGGKRF